MSWNVKIEKILCFWFCLEILSLTCDFCSNQTVFEDSNLTVLSSYFSKIEIFCWQKLVIFPKNGFAWSTSPRLVSPESSPPKRDTPCVIIWSSFLQEKNTKSEQNWWFCDTLWSPTFPTRSCAVYPWRSSYPPKSTPKCKLRFRKIY